MELATNRYDLPDFKWRVADTAHHRARRQLPRHGKARLNATVAADSCVYGRGAHLELRDVKIIKGEGTGVRILETEVRGKRGVGYCKSMPGAVMPFERAQAEKPQATEPIFGKTPRELMNAILEELNLKFDRDGYVHTFHSIRYTYICLRLLERGIFNNLPRTVEPACK